MKINKIINRDKSIEPIFFSNDNSAKFDINSMVRNLKKILKIKRSLEILSLKSFIIKETNSNSYFLYNSTLYSQMETQ